MFDTSGIQIFQGIVDFESIESFFGHSDKENDNPLICPKGVYNPYEVKDSNLNEIEKYSSDWIKNPKYELKCYYHREEPFLVF